MKPSDAEAISRMRVFVSSTFEDLRPYRDAVLESIHSLGSFTDDMVYWPADDRDARAYSIDRVKKSDLLVLVIAHRYGTGLNGAATSIVEAEYAAALDNNIPVLAFIIDDGFAWPPALCDWEHREQLTSLKIELKNKHAVRHFTTPDNLARLVTESLASFISKKTGAKLFTFPAGKYLVGAVERDNLAKLPDVVVGLQRAEDGLPLLCCIRRSGDLEGFFSELYARKPNLASVFPDDLVDELRSSLTRRKRLQTVQMLNGSTQLLYVSKANLAALFRSLFGLIIEQCRVAPPLKPSVLWIPPKHTNTTQPPLSRAPIGGQQLQSTGGSNRFLGLSLSDDKMYSVGTKDGRWVEWHPFVSESLDANFPKAQFALDDGRAAGEIQNLSDRLIQHAISRLKDGEDLTCGLTFTVSRQAVGLTCLRVANAIATYQSQKRVVHGDLKPSNILLTESGPRLVDAFDVPEGEGAPGWSPYWSPPELITGQPLCFKSDTYSFGRILGDLVAGQVIGEVRKFKIPPSAGGVDEVDLYFDPFVYIPKESIIVPQDGRGKWKSMIERCLKFRPEDRISIEDAAAQLQDYLVKYPLEGRVKIRILGDICAARMPNGAHVVARIIEDGSRPPAIPEIAIKESSQIAFFEK